MDRLRVRRPSRFLHFIISDRGACRRVRPDFYIYLYRPVLLNSDNPRRRHRNPPLRADLPLPPLPQTIRRDLYPPRFPLSFSLPPSSLFSFTFTLSLLLAATKLSAKGGDLRPPLPDSSTSNRLVHRLKSFFNNRPPSIVSDIYSTTLHERVSSLSPQIYSRYNVNFVFGI